MFQIKFTGNEAMKQSHFAQNPGVFFFFVSMRHNHLSCCDDSLIVSPLIIIRLLYLYSWMHYCRGQSYQFGQGRSA